MKRMILGAVVGVGILLISSVAVFANGRDDLKAGAVYTMTNAADGNHVVIFNRDEDGMLTPVGSIATGGKGYGDGLDPLASQDAIVLSSDNRWLLAVNGGSNEISVFRVLPDGLNLIDTVDSGGEFPVSVTIDYNLVYVLNAGGSPNIMGFSLSHDGHLTPLAGSTRSLDAAGAYSQVGFDPQGKRLVITDRVGNLILIYSVSDDGLPALNPVTTPSNGNVPFAFFFDARSRLLVVEAGPNAVSSYRILPNDTLQVISGSVPNGQQAACWIAGNRRGDIFTTNPGSGTVSAYQLSTRNGQVTLLNGAAGSGNKPLDLAITINGRFLYALDPGNGAIDMFRIERDGSLTDLGAIDAELSIFAQGIAAH
jgi:6-phosphogluconolactonase